MLVVWVVCQFVADFSNQNHAFVNRKIYPEKCFCNYLINKLFLFIGYWSAYQGKESGAMSVIIFTDFGMVFKQNW
ncbi:hypothetical protein CE273_08165 [Salmonella enterica subsp. enterica serovar 4,[5],12:b:-]|nr:hypothetical protein [Salmonella enterica]ECV2756539.1 hypothetical protein [Salmonella enterica subsp. enterica serovar 4,[5],12:b:-]